MPFVDEFRSCMSVKGNVHFVLDSHEGGLGSLKSRIVVDSWILIRFSTIESIFIMP